MYDEIKKSIIARIKDKNISIASLERQAGLKVNVARNIIVGYSKKPSAETILAISKALGCSVDHLMNNKINDKSYLQINDLKLFKAILDLVIDELEKRCSNFVLDTFYSAVVEIYQYCIEFQLATPDYNFCVWIIKNKFENTLNSRDK
jgi:lambda repressor-like predicted transcriptional regulator